MASIARAKTEQAELATRKETILADTAAEVARLDARLTELDAFLRVAESYASVSADDSRKGEHNGNGSDKSDDKELRRGDQKRMIEEALQANQHGLTKAGIAQWVEAKHGLTIAPNYIGVALDRMRGRIWSDWTAIDGFRSSEQEAKDDASFCSRKDQPGMRSLAGSWPYRFQPPVWLAASEAGNGEGGMRIPTL